MKVIFSQHFDQGYYLDRTVSENYTLFDISICGPKGLLSILERETGLSGKYLHHTERVLHYRGILGDFLTKNPEAFFARSFQTDPAGVARELLRWRDQLILTGWNGSVKGISKRFDVLAEIEQDTKTTPGEEDRWIRVLDLIQNQATTLRSLEYIQIEDRKEWLHPFYHKLFDALITKDIKVTFREKFHTKPSRGNLQLLKQIIGKDQAKRSDHTPIEKRKLDPADQKSFQILEFPNELQATEFLCAQQDLCKDAVIISENKLTLNLLQDPFRIPGSGASVNSMRPQLLQIMHLATSLLVKPLNIYNLISYLQIPIHPIPQGLRTKLLKLIGDNGGVPPALWEDALKQYEFKDDETRRKKKIFIEIAQNEKSSIPKERLIRFYNALEDWARKIMMSNEQMDELLRKELGELRAACKTLVGSLRESNKETLSLLELEILIGQINEPINANLIAEQSGSYDSIGTPGQLLSNARKIIWLDFHNHEIIPRFYDFLDDQELLAMNQKKLAVWTGGAQAFAQFEAIKKGILFAEEKLVLIKVDQEKDELTREHPLYSWLNGSIDELEKVSIRPTLEWTDNDYLSRDLQVPELESILKIPLPQKKAYHNITRGDLIKLRKKESYSSLTKLVDHPFDWVFEYGAEIKPGKILNPDDISTLLGNVSHRYIEELLSRADKRVEDARQILTKQYEEMLFEIAESYGAQLLLDQHKFEYHILSVQLRKSVGILLDLIQENELKIIEMEYDTGGELEILGGCEFSGFIDLLLENQKGEKVIFDLKWSRRDDRFQSMLIEGRAIQLALYRKLLIEKAKKVDRMGYFSLAGGQLFTAYRFKGKHIVYVDNAEQEDITLTKLEQSVNFRLKEFRDGKLEEGEGMSPKELAYYLQQQDGGNLVELSLYDKKKSTNGFSTLNPLKGDIK